MKNPEVGMIGVAKTFEVVGTRKHKIGGKDGTLRLKYGTSKEREYVTLLLGGKLKKDPMPNDQELNLILNSIGFIGTDQIEEFLGKKALSDLIRKLEEKYAAAERS